MKVIYLLIGLCVGLAINNMDAPAQTMIQGYDQYGQPLTTWEMPGGMSVTADPYGHHLLKQQVTPVPGLAPC